MKLIELSSIVAFDAHLPLIVSSLNAESVAHYMAIRLPFTDDDAKYDFHSDVNQKTFAIHHEDTDKTANVLENTASTCVGFLQMSFQNISNQNQQEQSLQQKNQEQPFAQRKNTQIVLSIWIMPKFQNQGYAKQALSEYLSQIHDIQYKNMPVYAYICTENFRSIHLFESLNFKKTARFCPNLENDFGIFTQSEYVLTSELSDNFA
jgi:RimJ/RimL family protein N-acetyltransferase